MSTTRHQLQWRGQTLGPWPLDRIRAALESGEIHSLYRIEVNGAWMPLREHLEVVDAGRLARRAAELGARDGMTALAKQTPFPSLCEAGLEAAKGAADFFGRAEKNTLFEPRRTAQTGAKTRPMTQAAGVVTADELAPTCWLAVAAFVISCSGLLPYLNLIAWLPGIVLGHLALRETDRQPVLEGRGLAVGALIISYSILAFALVTGLFAPDLFYRVFPLRVA